MTYRHHTRNSQLIACFFVVILSLVFSNAKAQLVTGTDTLQIVSGQWEYYDFTASTAFTIADTANYTPDIWGSSNEGVNFGKEFSPLIPSRRILLLGTGDIDTVTTVPTWTDAAPWIDTSWDWPNGTQGQPISPSELWVVYTNEGLYVVMQIDELPNGDFGDSFTFKFKYMSEGGTTLDESNLNDGESQIAGSSTIQFGEGFDFSREEIGDNNDAGDYQLDFAFVSNEGVNFGNEGSTSLAGTGRRFLLLGEGSLDSLTSVPERVDASPWVDVSYDFSDGTGGLPISVGQLWGLYTREGHYAAMEITGLPDGDFGNSFTFDYKYLPNGSRTFEGDTSGTVDPVPVYTIAIADGDSQTVAPSEFATQTLQILVTDENDDPVSSQDVSFKFTLQPANTTNDGIVSQLSTTDVSGIAQAQVSGGDAEGEYQIQATLQSDTTKYVVFSLFVEEADTSSGEIIYGSATSTNSTGFDFSREETGDNADAGDYMLDFAFVSNEGVNFGNESSSSLFDTGRRFILLGAGSLDTLMMVPERIDASPWVTVSYDFSDGTGGQPISEGQLWGVYTREGHYAAMEITSLPDGGFGNSFTFDYKYQPNGNRFFDGDTTIVVQPDPNLSIYIAKGDSQSVAPLQTPDELLEVLVVDENESPFEGESVNFEIIEQPISVSISASITQQTVTDTAGIAWAIFTSGDANGLYKIRASLSSDSTKFVTFAMFVNEEDTSVGETITGTITSSAGTGFDFSLNEVSDNEDFGNYALDFAFVSNEGVNFGNEGSSSLTNTGRRFLLLGEGSLDTLSSIPLRVDEAPWITVSYDFSYGTGGLPISIGQLWGVYTREGHYAAMEITDLPDGGFGNSFTFDYKYQPNGSRFFDRDTSIVVNPNPILSIAIAQGDSQSVAPLQTPDEFIEVLVTDENNAPFEGEPVNFEIIEEPFSVSISATVTQQTNTDTSGIAWALFTGGDASGLYKIRASLSSDSSKFVNFTMFVNEEDTSGNEIISGSSTGVNGRGFDFSREQIGGIVDADDYELDFAFVANEGVNFGNEGSASLNETGRRFLLLGEGSIDTLNSVPMRVDETPWVTVSYDFQDGTGGQPLSVGQLWGVYTREGHYAAMEITSLPDGGFGNSFTFDYKYQPNGSRFFDGDTSIVVNPDPNLSIYIAQGDSQIVASLQTPDELIEVLVTDENANPVEGEAVNFELIEQPLSVSVSATVTQQSITDTVGVAWALFTSGDASGRYLIRASIAKDSTKFVHFSLFVNEEDTSDGQTITGTITSTLGTGFDFSLNEVSDNEDFGNYQLDFAFVANEGVNFGNESSTSLANTGRRFLLLGEGSLDSLSSVPLRVDEAPWVTVSYDFQHGTGGQPISVGQLWAVYTREGHYAAMEITALPEGDFGNSFDFKYKYQVNGTRFFESDSSVVSTEDLGSIPEFIELSQNYPNPFNPSTNIEYSLNSNTQVLLEVFDISGRLVRTLVNKRQTAGVYAVTFDAQNLSTGVYIYRLKVGATHITKKMLLIK